MTAGEATAGAADSASRACTLMDAAYDGRSRCDQFEARTGWCAISSHQLAQTAEIRPLDAAGEQSALASAWSNASAAD
jgi:hypothetical protein